MYVALVNAGEIGGVLEQTLETMAQALDREMELREKVKSAFVYPIIVLVAAAGVVTVMLLFIIPVFENVYAQFHSQLPGPTRMLMAASKILTHYWWAVLIALVAAVWGIRSFLRTETGTRIWDRAKLRLPLLGKLIRKMTVLRFVRTLGALVAAGVPLLSALETATRVAGNTEFTAAIERVKGEVTEGASLSAPIRASGKFPNLVPRLIQVGEESGSLDAMLEKIAHFYDRDIEYTVKRLTTLMEPALTVVLGGIVGSIVIALYMPIFTLATVIRR
jgi:type IV pilus assembly protein PilC